MGLEIDRLRAVQMLVLDVDGVLTDARIWMDVNGEWRRFFSVRDGVGIKRLMEKGYKIAIITGSQAADIRQRAKNLGIHFFYEGALDKEPSFEALQKESGLRPEQMAYVGDDIFDIPLLKAVGFAATVPEAVDEVKDCVQYIARRPGGNGAVREICDIVYQYGAFA
ncbi:MAG: HAD-IIIA family hydrolase [Bdellovibrionaceae bacterium]|nr:HAD-IIIA family hydrolase [Pseudobdellovibrionaceae bacterium]